jgi:hypothetical protein
VNKGKRHKESKSGRRIQTRQGPVHQGLVHPHAAGLDVGVTGIYVAAPPAGEEPLLSKTAFSQPGSWTGDELLNRVPSL